jgi:hypothetical protein
MSQPTPEPERAEDSRWELIRDVLVFQLKFALEATRDVVLAFLSLLFGVIDLALGRRGEDSLFYGLLRVGVRFDRWLDLFAPVMERDETVGADRQVARLEQILREQHDRGGFTAQTARHVDQLLDRVEQGLAGALRGESAAADDAAEPESTRAAERERSDQRDL